MIKEGYFGTATVCIDVYYLLLHHFVRLLSLFGSQMGQLQHASLSDGSRLLFFDIGEHTSRAVSHLTKHTIIPLIQNENHFDYHAVDPC